MSFDIPKALDIRLNSLLNIIQIKNSLETL